MAEEKAEMAAAAMMALIPEGMLKMLVVATTPELLWPTVFNPLTVTAPVVMRAGGALEWEVRPARKTMMEVMPPLVPPPSTGQQMGPQIMMSSMPPERSVPPEEERPARRPLIELVAVLRPSGASSAVAWMMLEETGSTA